MKSNKLMNKTALLALTAMTVLGSSASLYAKSWTTITYKKFTWNRPSISIGSGSTNTGSAGNGSAAGSTNTGSAGSTSTAGSTNNGTAAATTSQTALENKVLELVNAQRAKYGLKALQMDESVRKVARTKATDMSTKKYFSHTSPTYGTPFEMLKSFGISYSKAGENIAQGYTTAEAVVNGWMSSSGHRANILNASYTHIGIGYEANGNYWTQMFIAK